MPYPTTDIDPQVRTLDIEWTEVQRIKVRSALSILKDNVAAHNITTNGELALEIQQLLFELHNQQMDTLERK